MASSPFFPAFGDGDAGQVDPLAGYVVGVLGTDGVDRLAQALAESGAEVLRAYVLDASGARRLFDTVARGIVDAIVVLDPGAAAEVATAIHRLRIGGELRTALRGRTLVVGPDSTIAASLASTGISVSTPIGAGAGAGAGVGAGVGGDARGTFAAAAHLVAEQVPVLRGRHCIAAGHTLDVRSQAVVLDGELRPLPASAMALLRALAHQPGHVVTREKLLARLPGEKVSGHAVDVAIGRLRTALGDPAIVATVVKRGYRLATP